MVVKDELITLAIFLAGTAAVFERAEGYSLSRCLFAEWFLSIPHVAWCHILLVVGKIIPVVTLGSDVGLHEVTVQLFK